jgi:hypothetical protein
MKTPTTFTIGRRPASRPGYEATSVVPQENAVPATVARAGRAIEEAGSEAQRTEEILTGRVDLARAQEADAKIADGYRTLMFSPEGYTNRIGREAVDKRQEIITALDDHRRQILDPLTPRQRKLIAASDETRYQHVRSQVDGHYMQQISAYEMAETEARANSLMLDASNGYFAATAPVMPQEQGQQSQQSSVDASYAEGVARGEITPQGPDKGPPSAFTDNRKAMQSELQRLAAQKGLGPDAVKALLQHADNNLYGSIITRLVGSNRALEAADLLRESPDVTLSQETRARLQRDVQEAGVAEQGFHIARVLGQSGRDLGEQLDALAQLHEKGSISLLAHDAAEKRILANDKVQHEALGRAGEKALTDAQTWQSLNPTVALPESERSKLRATGKEAAFDLWTLQGKQFVTTDQARLEEQTMDDKMLANRFESHVELAQSFAHRMSPEDFGKLTLRWRKARGEALDPKDALALEHDVAEKNFLQASLFYDNFKSTPGSGGMARDSISSRESRFHEAVVLRVNQLAAEGKTLKNNLYKLAIEDVWKNGAVVDDKWLPTVMMTKEEVERAKSEVTAATRKAYSLEFQMSGQQMPSQAYLVTGERVNLASTKEDDRVFTFDELSDKMKADRHGVDPTYPEVSAEFARLERDRLQRTKDAKEIASVLNKTRAATLMQQLPAEFDREFNRQYGQMLATRAAEMKTVRGGYQADRGVYGRIPSTGEIERERVETSKTPSRDRGFASPARPGELTQIQSVYQDAVRTVLSQHRKEITGYGLRDADIVQGVIPDTRLPGNAPVRFGLTPGGANPLGTKPDLSFTQAEQEFLTDMRKRYKKTEFVESK